MKTILEKIQIDDFLEVISDAVILVNANQELVFQNKYAEELFGYSNLEIRGQPLNILIPERYHQSHINKFEKFMNSASNKRIMVDRREVTAIRRDGSEFPIEANIAKLIVDHEMIFAVFLRDISERKRIEGDLEKWAQAFEHAEWGVVVGEANTRNLQVMNPAFAKMYGYSIQELSGKPIESVYAPSERSKIETWLKQAHEKGHITYESRHIRRNQTEFPVIVNITAVKNPQGMVLYRVVNVTDISELKRAESALHENEKQMYRLMEEQVKESTRELSALLEISRNLVSTLDLAPLLKTILVQLKMVVDFSGAAIARLSGDEFNILEYLGPVSRDAMLNFRVSAEQDTGYRRVMMSKKPYIINDIWKDDPWLHSLQEKVSTELADALKPSHSWMGVPLIYQNQILGILRLDHVQPNFFTERDAALVTTFAELAAIAIRNADLFENAQYLAALEERQKLARELHDSVSQALYGIALGARTARTLLERNPSKAAEPLDYCLYLAETGLAEMRALIFELRPESLEKEGLVSALTKVINAWKARYQIETSVHFGLEPPVSLNVKETFYRISQEVLNNIVKHARANKVEIRLDSEDGILFMEILDNGRGFDPTAEKPGHFGLSSMRERAQRIGARLNMDSAIGIGTKIRLEINLAAK